MADHRHTGQAVLDGVRDAGNRWVFTDAGEPWGGVKMVLVSGSPHARHAVDVSATLERGIDSLRAHHAYLAYVGTDPDPFLREAAEGMGKQLGVTYATTFEVFPF
jgi:LmbE family N-acetylglucosaminyl deacetylase